MLRRGYCSIYFYEQPFRMFLQTLMNAGNFRRINPALITWDLPKCFLASAIFLGLGGAVNLNPNGHGFVKGGNRGGSNGPEEVPYIP